jgi:hypothetical protein
LNSNAAAAQAPIPPAAAPDAGADADDDVSPPSSEGRVTRDAGATPPMRIEGGVGGEGAEKDGAELNGRCGENGDDDENDDDDGHESGSSGPCQLPPLAARSAIVKRRQAAAANRVSRRRWLGERERKRERERESFSLFSYKCDAPLAHLDLFFQTFPKKLKNPGCENAHARGVQRRRRGRRRRRG